MIIRYYLKRRKAVGHFRKELIAHGVSPQAARELGSLYPFKLREIIGMTRNFTGSRPS
jgi:hypothetical protein